MRKLWSATLGAIILLCLSVGVALAQSEETLVPFCGQLSEDECAAVDGSSQLMAELTSGTSENQIKIYATGAALGDQELSLVLTWDRTFVTDDETLARMNELRAMPADQFAADPAAITEAALLPFTIDREQSVSLAFSPELVARLEGSMQTTVPSSITFQARIVNGTLYIRLADFQPFMPQPDWVPEWIGIETRALLSTTVSSAVAKGTMNAAAVQNGLIPPGAALEGQIIYHVPADDLAYYADFMNLAGLGASEQDGEMVQRYALTWDLARYLGGPLFAQHTGEESFPSAKSRLYGSMATILLDGLTTGMTQANGVNNSLVYSVDTVVNWPIGVPGGPPIAERPTLGLSMSMHNSDLNQVRRISVPQGAYVPPINLLIGVILLFQ